MKDFTESGDLLDDPDALRERFDRDGYLLLRGAVDPEPLARVRRDITDICARHDWLRPGTDPLDAIPQVEPRVEGEDLFFEVYDDIQRLESFHSVPHDPSLRRCITPLLGDDAFPHPLGISRLAFPASGEWATPPHQDFPNNQGTPELYATWMPLGDCPIAQGPLRILEGSHRLGLMPLVPSLGAGFRRAGLTPEHDALEWVSGDLALGDVLVFHSLTVHASLPNQSEGMRLSIDYRFQADGDRITEGCLEPHFGRLSWDEIYRGWDDDTLERYWLRRRYEIVPFDHSMFEVSEPELEQQIKDFVQWRRKHPRVEVESEPTTA